MDATRGKKTKKKLDGSWMVLWGVVVVQALQPVDLLCTPRFSGDSAEGLSWKEDIDREIQHREIPANV